jgi:sarcosine oxidase, subunit alpha
VKRARHGKTDALRLDPQPGEVIDRSRRVEFSWNGRTYDAYDGDSVVSALMAAGQRSLSRSFKFHRRRGVLTADQHDPNCFFTIDGQPNMPGAHVQVRHGMVARSQNVWPTLELDARSANQALGRFLGAGFYYKTFMAPRALRGSYQAVLQRFSPGGQLGAAEEGAYYDKRFLFHDVVVAGAGPAGIAAALGAAEAGARVLLVEEDHAVGGHLRWGGPADLALLRELRRSLEAAERVDVLVDSTVFGRYDQNWVGVHERAPADGEAVERLHKGRPRTLIVATGLLERPWVFPGNDLPGVLLSTAARRLVGLHAVRPGQRAVVLSANGDGDAAAEQLEAVGCGVVRVDARKGHTVRRAMGRGALAAVELSDGHRIEADVLVTATGWTAQSSLLSMSGIPLIFDMNASRYVPAEQERTDVVATGGLVGDGSREQLVEHGAAVGRAAGYQTAAVAAAPALSPKSHPALFTSGTDGIVDFSEDVSAHDIRDAAHEGYSSIELAKRYTTATMGPTQGLYSVINTSAVLAEATGRSIEDTGTPTSRPPYSPVSIGALAGRRFHPERETAMHPWHVQAGATFMHAGEWLRPQHYGDPLSEARNVRETVGVIDVSTLGKFELSGTDVARLLNLLYVNSWSKLGVGSVRYGVMCTEDGIVLDDGVTGRLTPTRYLLSATSSGAGRVANWLRAWQSALGENLDVAVTDVTDAFASLNVAGPRSRDVLRPLIEAASVEADGLGYMKAARATVAGVPNCFLWRIGFTGELSYELHVPAGYGLHVWEAVLERGREFGIRPFGVDAQRTLRIEKGHAVVGQDTDALTGPDAIGLGSLVKSEKLDMAGRPELVHRQASHEPPPYRLVGLQTTSSEVPPESTQLIAAGRPVGRITSSCWSPTLNRPVCLALVAPEHATPGERLQLLAVDGSLLPVRVTDELAQVDPEGNRLHA